MSFTYRNPGRPEARDWAAERATIEGLIAQGWGIGSIAKRYGMSLAGMPLVFQRHGYESQRQSLKRRSLDALIAREVSKL